MTPLFQAHLFQAHRARIFVIAAAVAAVLPSGEALAHVRHRHVAKAPLAVAPPPPAPSFYPENIEGGSPGNLAFNNQIRKLRDPLNANGAGR